MDELTNEQHERVKDYFKRIGLKKCPVCDSKSVTAHKMIVTLMSPPADKGVLYGRRAYMLVCNNCTHIMLFDLDLLAIVPGEPSSNRPQSR